MAISELQQTELACFSSLSGDLFRYLAGREEMMRPTSWYASTVRMALPAAIAAALSAFPVRAQDFPSRIVKVVNPYVSGSTTDVLARSLTVGMAKRLGREFIVENRPGAAGAIGTLSVARAEPDGYTLLFAPATVLSVVPQARDDAGYRPDALAPVCQTFVNAMALAVRPDQRLKSVADLVAAARSKPGALNYGHQGPLSIPHLAMEELLLTANIDITSVPFRGDPLVITELLGGRIDVGSLVLGAISGQNVRVIGIFSDARHGSYPDVPTVREQGYDISSESFGGVLAPAGTPAAVIGRLAAACAGAAQDDAYVNAARATGQPSDYFADAAMFSQRLERDIARKTRVLARVMK
jgi:tripartite-type tricarboxylate transporter receptor subunit TctC